MNIEEKVKVLVDQLELLKSICKDSSCTFCRIREVCMKLSFIPGDLDSDEIRKLVRDIMSITKEGDAE